MGKNSFFGIIRSGLISILFFVYKFILSPFLHAISGSGLGCRFPETCSAYSERMLREKGLLRGTSLAAKRIVSCNPWKKGIWETNHS